MIDSSTRSAQRDSVPRHRPVASFRDPAGGLVCTDGRIFRVVNQLGVPDVTAFLNSKSAQRFIRNGCVVRTAALDAAEVRSLFGDPEFRDRYDALHGQMVVEHERIPFSSYPYEWPPEMMHAAGMLTLDLAQDLLPEGFGLKDGTPYNVLFRGTEPVFVDLLSFERRDAGDPTWLPYAQFVRTFLLPLLANKTLGIALDQILTVRRDGLEPEEIYRWLKTWQKFKPPFLGLVSFPTWLGSKYGQDDTAMYAKKTLPDPAKARFILNSLFNGLRRALKRVEPKTGRRSAWSDYILRSNHYPADGFASKEDFVREALHQFPSQSVLDVGCNTGHFSVLAAQSGARVVAIDSDPVVLGDLWRNSRFRKLDILPLAVNLTRPSPGIGWRNQECSSFLDRARGAFDTVLMLAVIHHMLVTERVPLPDILDLAAELTTNLLIIEFVGPEDSMFRRLTRGREELHKGLNHTVFEAACQRNFAIVREQHAEGSARWLYLLKKRPVA